MSLCILVLIDKKSFIKIVELKTKEICERTKIFNMVWSTKRLPKPNYAIGISPSDDNINIEQYNNGSMKSALK